MKSVKPDKLDKTGGTSMQLAPDQVLNISQARPLFSQMVKSVAERPFFIGNRGGIPIAMLVSYEQGKECLPQRYLAGQEVVRSTKSPVEDWWDSYNTWLSSQTKKKKRPFIYLEMSTSTFTNKPLLADTSFIVSLYITNDSNYPQALDFFKAVVARKNIVKITNLIFVEVATILSQGLGKVGLKSVMQHGIFSDYAKNGIFIDEPFFRKVVQEFLKSESKNISLVDMSTALVAEERGFDVVTFDNHLTVLGKKYGFKVLP